MSKPPLWWAMHRADQNVKLSAEQHDHWPRYIKAAEIRAVRDWLFPAGRPGDDSCCDVMLARLWDQLTTEADRAEAGDG